MMVVGQPVSPLPLDFGWKAARLSTWSSPVRPGTETETRQSTIMRCRLDRHHDRPGAPSVCSRYSDGLGPPHARGRGASTEPADTRHVSRRAGCRSRPGPRRLLSLQPRGRTGTVAARTGKAHAERSEAIGSFEPAKTLAQGRKVLSARPVPGVSQGRAVSHLA